MTAAAVGASACPGAALGEAGGARPDGMRLAFQAFAVRDLCTKDFAGTLKAAKALGYEGLETGRFFGLDAKGLKAACDDAGIELIALQLYPHNLTEPQLGETIGFCRDCGCRRTRKRGARRNGHSAPQGPLYNEHRRRRGEIPRAGADQGRGGHDAKHSERQGQARRHAA